jgi:hypothetical protein
MKAAWFATPILKPKNKIQKFTIGSILLLVEDAQ